MYDMLWLVEISSEDTEFSSVTSSVACTQRKSVFLFLIYVFILHPFEVVLKTEIYSENFSQQHTHGMVSSTGWCSLAGLIWK